MFHGWRGFSKARSAVGRRSRNTKVFDGVDDQLKPGKIRILKPKSPILRFAVRHTKAFTSLSSAYSHSERCPGACRRLT